MWSLGSLISSPLEVNGDFVQRPVKLKDARYASVTVDPGSAPSLGDLTVTREISVEPPMRSLTEPAAGCGEEEHEDQDNEVCGVVGELPTSWDRAWRYRPQWGAVSLVRVLAVVLVHGGRQSRVHVLLIDHRCHPVVLHRDEDVVLDPGQP
jgi:hypothetical protein